MKTERRGLPHWLIGPTLILLYMCIGTPGLLAQTTPEWTSLNSGVAYDLYDLSFPDVMHGFAVGDSGTVLRTSDGGSTWEQLSFPTNQAVTSVSFADPQNGWALSNVWIFRTTDGGDTWVEDSVENGLNVLCYPGFVRMWDENYGIWGGRQCFQSAGASTYDGVRWSYGVHVGTQSWPYNWAKDLSFIDSLTAVTVGDTGFVARTTDGGATWTQITSFPDTTQSVNDVFFFPDGTGYAVNDDEFTPLYKSTDGGLTWGLDSTWESTFWYPHTLTISTFDQNHKFVGGAIGWGSGTGLIMRKTGTDWWYFEEKEKTVRQIVFADTIGYAVGDSGMIWKRGDVQTAVASETSTIEATVWPNPADAQVRVRAEGLEAVQLFDLNGRMLRQTAANRGEQEALLMTEDLPAGMYMLRIRTKAGEGTRKLIIH